MIKLLGTVQQIGARAFVVEIRTRAVSGQIRFETGDLILAETYAGGDVEVIIQSPTMSEPEKPKR